MVDHVDLIDLEFERMCFDPPQSCTGSDVDKAYDEEGEVYHMPVLVD